MQLLCVTPPIEEDFLLGFLCEHVLLLFFLSLKAGHLILLLSAVLCAFVEYPGNPLTEFPTEIRSFLKTVRRSPLLPY